MTTFRAEPSSRFSIFLSSSMTSLVVRGTEATPFGRGGARWAVTTRAAGGVVHASGERQAGIGRAGIAVVAVESHARGAQAALAGLVPVTDRPCRRRGGRVPGPRRAWRGRAP